jgi:hypothetical protein
MHYTEFKPLTPTSGAPVMQRDTQKEMLKSTNMAM